MGKKRLKKVVKISDEAHRLLKFVSFKKSKDMSDVASDTILEMFKAEREELEIINKSNKE